MKISWTFFIRVKGEASIYSSLKTEVFQFYCEIIAQVSMFVCHFYECVHPCCNALRLQIQINTNINPDQYGQE